MDPSATAAGFRSGIVAVIGRANVGKSTLVNALVGEKISIVSPVAQTTRHRIRGILNLPAGQVVFIDTPGILKAESDLGEWMNRSARQAAEGADVIVLVTDASASPRPEDEGWFRRMVRANDGVPLIIALNKCDASRRHEADIRAAWNAAAAGREPATAPEWLRLSAVTGEGLPELVSRIMERIPEHPPLFPDDILTDFPRKLFMADIVREKLFLRLKSELPHRVACHVVEVMDAPDGTWTVTAEIWVERASQKGIVIGDKGRMLRAIRRASEAELSAIYERPVRVLLHVTVKDKWTRNYWHLKTLGMDL